MNISRNLLMLVVVASMALVTVACDDDSNNDTNNNNTNNVNNTNNLNNTNNVNNINNTTDLCGNGDIDAPEVCDGVNVGTTTCIDENHDGGTLACSADCSEFVVTGCCDDSCPAEGDSRCSNNSVGVCTLEASGCLAWVDTDCGSEVCDDSGNDAVCVVACEDDCTTDGEVSCLSGVLTSCSNTDSDSCLDLTVTDCNANGEFCDIATSACLANGSGDSCDDVYVVDVFPFTLAGDNFLTDYTTDDHDFSAGTNCSGTNSAIANDAVFQLNLKDGDSLTVKDFGGIDFVIHLVTDDSIDCLNVNSCIDSIDDPEDVLGLTYDASGDQTVYVVVEPYYESPSTTDYDLSIDVKPSVCGDGAISILESCDDGNIMDGDGCDSSCEFESGSGLECTGEPTVCYVLGSGDTCADAIEIVPGSFSFDSTGYTNDYDSYDGLCGTGEQAFGLDMVFSIEVPSGATLSVAMANETNDAVLVVADDCSGITDSCLDLGDDPENVRYFNDATVLKTIYIIGDAYYSDDEVAFDLDVEIYIPTCNDGLIEGLEECDDGNSIDGDGCNSSCLIEAGFDCVAEPSYCFTEGSGDTCDTPIMITAPASFTFETSSFTDDYGSNDYSACGDAGMGPDSVFAIDVPAGDTLTVTGVNQTRGAIIFSTNCADLEDSCFASDDSYSSDLLTQYENLSGSATTVFVIIDSYVSTTDYDVTIDLDFSLYTPICGDSFISGGEACDDGNANDGDGCDSSCQIEVGFDCVAMPSYCFTEGSGDTCDTPIMITAPASFTFETSTFTDDYGSNDYSACGDGGLGPDAVFAIDVPAGDTLTVKGVNQNYGAIIFSTDCADLEDSCFAYDEAYSSDILTEYENASGSATTVFVIIDSYNTFTDYDVTVDLDFSLYTPICGDGIITTGETCDDGNTTPGDGCNAFCVVEAGFDCVGEPSNCLTLIYSEDFSTWPPPAMSIVDGGDGGTTWEQCASGTCQFTSFDGPFAMIDSDAAGFGAVFDDSMITPVLDFTGYTKVTLYFDHYYEDYSGNDSAEVAISTDGATFTPVMTWTSYDESSVEIDLSDYAGESTVNISFRYVSGYDYYWLIDSIKVLAE
jgi:cysteine-rich repeat protein